ncbi:MAG: hypothetical protein GW890_11625, partial [Vibrio sp.]|nr:hypothetical protein [Vibrio sp.]
MMKRILIGLSLVIGSLSLNASELSATTVLKVQKAQQFALEENLTQAIEVMSSVETSRLYDKAFVARMLGVFYWQSAQPKAAIKQIKYAVESGELQDEQAWTTERMLADLYVNEQQFEKALPHYYQLLKSVPPSQKVDDLWLRIAQTHYQIAQWEKVLHALDKYQTVTPLNTKNPLSLKLGA